MPVLRPVLRPVLLLLTLAAALLLGACGGNGEKTVENMTALIVETSASNRGPAAFIKAGVEVSGPLSCQAQPSESQYTVSCTGTSLDGRPLTLTGTASSAPGGSSVAGTFTGTAGGTPVFTLDCLGDCG